MWIYWFIQDYLSSKYCWYFSNVGGCIVYGSKLLYSTGSVYPSANINNLKRPHLFQWNCKIIVGKTNFWDVFFVAQDPNHWTFPCPASYLNSQFLLWSTTLSPWYEIPPHGPMGPKPDPTLNYGGSRGVFDIRGNGS